MKNRNLAFSVLSLSFLLLLANCKEKEEPMITDFAQFMVGEWTISETFTSVGVPDLMDDCNRETSYSFGLDGILNINPRATASDENNNSYCAAVLNDGMGVDVTYQIIGDRMESQLGNATLQKVTEQSVRLTFDDAEFGIVVLER